MGSWSLSPTFMVVFFLLVLLQLSRSATAACKSHAFPHGKTYVNCADLPQHDAALHWTFDARKSSLSMAFMAAPPTADGWVAWGLNPKLSGMVGTQALVSGKFDGSSVTADMFDIMSYHAVIKGPISYHVTGISTEQSADGKITIFADWIIPAGVSTVNQVWQVGPIVGGKPGKHAVEQANLSSTMKLSFAGGAGKAAGSPAEAPKLDGESHVHASAKSHVPAPAMAPESHVPAPMVAPESAAPVSGKSHVPGPAPSMAPVASVSEESHAPALAPAVAADQTKVTTVAGAGERMFLSRSVGLGLVSLVVYSFL